MKGFGMLLWYFFTWRSVIVGSVFAGLALTALAMSIGTLSPSAAGAVSMIAFVLLFCVPYLAAPKALRTIITNRRLAIVPGLPFRTGLALLVLTLLTAGYMPFSGMLLGAPEFILWLGPQVFVLASLYAMGLQLVVTSRYMWFHVQWLPIAMMVLLTLFGAQLRSLMTDRAALLALATSVFAGWLYVLVILARRRNFKPAQTTDVRTADRETSSLLSSLFSRTPERGLSPVTSLLLGYPANIRARVINIVFLMVLNPLLAVALAEFMARRNGDNVRLGGIELFLAISLFTCFVAGAMAWSETGARSRLLWLRVPGARAQLWHKLEHELWSYIVLLLAVAGIVVAFIALRGHASLLLVHYVLALFSLTIYQRYLPLASRLNGWSSLTQALVVLASVAAIVLTLLYSLKVGSFNLAFLLELCLLLVGVLFRAIAKFGFDRVDWQVVRPTRGKDPQEVTA